MQFDLANVLIAISGAFLSGVVWFVRLEGEVKNVKHRLEQNEKNIDEQRIRHEALDSKIVDKLVEIGERLARIEGALSSKEE